MFASRSDKAEFARNLVSVVRAAIAFYKHCVGGGCVVGGVVCEPNISKVMTTVELVASLLPNCECRERAISGIAGISFDGGHFTLLCGNCSLNFREDARSIEHIMRNVLHTHYYPSIGECRSASLVNFRCGLLSSDSVASVGGVEGLLGCRLDHLRNTHFHHRRCA